jgi:hypothetical protein
MFFRGTQASPIDLLIHLRLIYGKTPLRVPVNQSTGVKSGVFGCGTLIKKQGRPPMKKARQSGP